MTTRSTVAYEWHGTPVIKICPGMMANRRAYRQYLIRSSMGDQSVMVADKTRDGDKATYLVPANASCWWGGGIFGVESGRKMVIPQACH